MTWVPRIVLQVVLRPPIEAVRYAERKQLPERIYWTFTSDDELRGVRPILRFESGFAIGLGARYFDRKLLGRDSLLDFRIAGSAPPVLNVELRLRPSADSPVPVGVFAGYDARDDALFGGIHGESDDDLAAQGREEARYGYRRVLARVEVEHDMGAVALLADGAFDVRSYRDGDSSRGTPISQVFCADPGGACMEVDETLVPGFDDGQRLLVAGAGVEFDTRSAARAGGWFGSGRATMAWGVMGDASRFAAGRLEAGHAFDFGDRLLILRGAAMVVEPVSDDPVPFEQLADPGGPHGVRGVRTGRLRDRSALVGTVEYRWLILPAFDLAVFGDAGGAFGSWFEGVSTDDIVPAAGVGLHVFHGRGPHWRTRPLLAVQVAWSPDEGVRLLLSAGD